ASRTAVPPSGACGDRPSGGRQPGMIVIAGNLPVPPDQKAAAEAACRTMSAASKAEDGCGAYEFSWDIHDPNLLRIHEQWESQAAIDAHFAPAPRTEFGG